MTVIHDFARLGERTSRRDRWLALGGPSGSGKSTLTRWLLSTHRGWQGPSLVVQHDGPRLDLAPARALRSPHIVLVDEVVTIGQLGEVAGLLARGHRLLVCSHLPAVCHLPLRLAGPGRFVSTAVAGEAKIARELEQRGLRFTPRAVRTYLRRFGPVYPEIDIVLERCPSDDFDRALRRFDKFHRVTRGPA
ncbi:MAG: hypothetical protein AAF602_23565 [Myxococcota bacterium]